MDYLPTKLSVSKADLAQARKLLAEGKVIIRYLRKSPTVGLKYIPAKDDQGKIIEDAPMKRVQVICHGEPVACMVAVEINDALRIGWSRRMDAVKLVKTDSLHNMFKKLADVVFEHHTDAKDYDETFRFFCDTMLNIISAPTKDVEENSYSKDAGRTSATIRGLLDEIIIDGKVMKSEASGPIPNDVARALRKFIPQLETKFGKSAENVIRTASDKKDSLSVA